MWKNDALNSWTKLRKLLLGVGDHDGLLKKAAVYLLLIAIGFVYSYPVLFMAINSMMSLDDLVNSMVKWIPTTIYMENYIKAWKVLDYPATFVNSMMVAAIPSLLQTISTGIIGYGFARFQFPFKKLLFALMLATFVIPPQITMMPTFLMYKNYGLLGSLGTFMYPALLGQGLKSALFILIFYQFFNSIPKVLEEAAEIDGAGSIKLFYRIAVPMAGPAILIVFLFSFVWYWNETYLAGLYFGNELPILPLELQKFTDTYDKLYPAGSPGNQINEGIKLSGTLLTIAPLLLLYFVLQRWFIESIDRTGITGE